MFGIKVQEKNETSILCAMLLIYKSYVFLLANIYGEKKEKIIPYFALHFQHFFLPY